MSALTRPETSSAHVHQQFVAALPAMENVIRFRTRRLPRRHRAEAVADGLAACWHAWSGLVRRGRDPRAVGPCGIAQNAARYVRNGRRLGCGTGRSVGLDVYDPRARRRLGLRLLRLDRHEGEDAAAGPETWREWLAVDNAVTPADEACFRLDFAAWLAGLPARKRQMAELLAAGHGTSEVARLLGVTLPAVSLARTWLEASWRAFQGEDERQEVAHVRRPVGRPRKDTGRACGQAHGRTRALVAGNPS